MKKNTIVIITIFPNIFDNFLKFGSIKKAINKNLMEVIILDLKKFSNKRVDDFSYGGNKGMVIKCEPLYNSIEYAKNIFLNKDYKIIYLSPQGKILNQEYIEELSTIKSIILICGRYEGIDERIIKLYVDEELSIGNYVLNGGEIPSMVILESISRLLPGIINNKEFIQNESFKNKLLEHPNYTRPRIFMNIEVPRILVSGNHKEIYKWRIENSLINTINKRPDLIKNE